MKTAIRHALLALLLGSSATGALLAAEAGAVTVIFSQPEKYADLKDDNTDNDNAQGRGRYLPPLQEHLQREAGRLLTAGQKLTVTFTDIDLAGDFEPWHGPQFDHVRILKDIYMPRLTFKFTLTDASGKVLREGERKLADPAYQMRITRAFPNDDLRYEKDMLGDWLRDEFRPKRN